MESAKGPGVTKFNFSISGVIDIPNEFCKKFRCLENMKEDLMSPDSDESILFDEEQIANSYSMMKSLLVIWGKIIELKEKKQEKFFSHSLKIVKDVLASYSVPEVAQFIQFLEFLNEEPPKKTDATLKTAIVDIDPTSMIAYLSISNFVNSLFLAEFMVPTHVPKEVILPHLRNEWDQKRKQENIILKTTAFYSTNEQTKRAPRKSHSKVNMLPQDLDIFVNK